MTLTPYLGSPSQPVQSSNPDRAVLIERNASERLSFVVETKSSLLTDDLRDRESVMIKCGESHFGGLMQEGVNPAAFNKASELKDVFTECLCCDHRQRQPRTKLTEDAHEECRR